MFGISEPAIFGVNLRYKFPLVGGCLAAAVAGAYVYFTHLTSLGFGTTAVPGLAIANPANNGYLNYIVAHLIALGLGILFTMVLGRFRKEEKEKRKAEKEAYAIPVIEAKEGVLYSPINGTAAVITECSDPVFNSRAMGDGMVFHPKNGTVVSPVDGTIVMTFPTKHALGIRTKDGKEILIHMGLNTVTLEGKPFELFVGENDEVKAGQKLAQMDLAMVEEAGLSTETPVIVTSGQKVNPTNTGPVNWGDAVMEIVDEK